MAVAILYYPNFKIKTILWKLTPYQYNQILYFPNNSIVSATSSQKEKSENLKILKKNSNRNQFDIDYWNYIFFLENLDRENRTELDKSFYKTLILSANNPKKNLQLKKYFFNNYEYFSKEYLYEVTRSILLNE